MKIAIPRNPQYAITVLLVECPEGRCKMSFGPEHSEADIPLPDGVREEEVNISVIFQGCPDEPFVLKEAEQPEIEEIDDEDDPDEDVEEAGEEAASEGSDEEADREVEDSEEEDSEEEEEDAEEDAEEALDD